jgi:hypothetical protein
LDGQAVIINFTYPNIPKAWQDCRTQVLAMIRDMHFVITDARINELPLDEQQERIKALEFLGKLEHSLASSRNEEELKAAIAIVVAFVMNPSNDRGKP